MLKYFPESEPKPPNRDNLAGLLVNNELERSPLTPAVCSGQALCKWWRSYRRGAICSLSSAALSNSPPTKAAGECSFFLRQLTMAHIINLALRLKPQISQRKKQIQQPLLTQRFTPGPPVSWLGSRCWRRVSKGWDKPSTELWNVVIQQKERKKSPAFLAARWYLQTLCS